MATIVRGPRDKTVLALKGALDAFETQFPGSVAELYRQNSGSIRVRIIDDRYAGTTRSRRHDQAWRYLATKVDEETMSEISLLLLMSTTELSSSLMNLEFMNPTSSKL